MSDRRHVDVLGRTAGKLRVVAIVGTLNSNPKGSRAIVSCRCECGELVERRWHSLASAAAQGKTSACETCTSRLRREQMPEINRRRWHGEPETA